MKGMQNGSKGKKYGQTIILKVKHVWKENNDNINKRISFTDEVPHYRVDLDERESIQNERLQKQTRSIPSWQHELET